MKVGIDASVLFARKQPTGVHRYVHSLITHLVALARTEQFELILYFSSSPAKNRTIPILDLLRESPHIQWRIPPIQRGWRGYGMGLTMLWDRLDVFHYPVPMISTFCPKPAVVTVHDLAALSLEKDYVAKERKYLQETLIAIDRAAALIAVSDSAGEEVRRHSGGKQVWVIKEGVEPGNFKRTTAAEQAAVKAKYKLDKYIISVGTLQTRKNYLRLMDAFEQIQRDVPHDLVIVGVDGSGAAEIHARMSERPNPRIHLLGYVEEALLPALYSAADGLALVSLWEGFGLPLLEAMACQTPTLTANNSSLQEVAGEAALSVDPHSTDDIAAKLKQLLTDVPLRQRLIEAGTEQVKKFSWAAAAQQTVAVYRIVAGSGNK